MKTRILFALFSLMLAGCAPEWVVRCEPTTEAERKAILDHAERILAATPRSLSGHDQDWDDAIREAHYQATQAVCRKTMWEWQPTFGGGHLTGRWKYVEEAKP